MSTKVLFVLSLLLIVIAGYFYASNDANLGKLNLKPSDIDYQASQVDGLQTDTNGEISYRLKAQTVTHYQNAKTAVLSQPDIVWRTANQKQVQLTAEQAQLDEAKQLAQLSGNVKMTSQSLDPNQVTPPITLTGQNFIGNLATKQVVSNQPIKVEQGNNQFTAKTINANADTGDYEFEQVSMTFLPAKN